MNDFRNPQRSQVANAVALADGKFELGQVLVTAGVHALARTGDLDPLACLARHAAGDWGDLPATDRELNARALQGGARIFSVYEISPTLKVYVITEWDRSVTTLLLPSEY